MAHIDENEHLAKGFLASFLLGAAAGVTAGLLFAPKSGRELRKDIQERAGTFLTNAGDILAAVGTRDGVLGPQGPGPWLSEKDVGEFGRGDQKGST